VVRNIFSAPGDEIFASGNDNIELLKAWAGSTVAFAVWRTGGSQLFSPAILTNLLVAAVVCGLAFVLHELAHRVVARSYGAEAHFVANNQLLLLSIVVSFAGVFFAAPGAVWHRGYLTQRQGGLIALAGPVTNLALALIFLLALIASVALRLPLPLWAGDILYDGFRFNAWLGLFNMIPAGPFDGAKVLAWDWRVFAITVAVGIGLCFGLNDAVIFGILNAL
jgi:Zn-dependent protease